MTGQAVAAAGTTSWARALVLLRMALALVVAVCGAGAARADDAAQALTPLRRVTTAEVAQAIAGDSVWAFAPVYDVLTYRLTYMTSDGQGQPVQASGLVAVPVKAAGRPSPVISYQHATIFQDARAPSNNPTPSEPSVLLASLGAVVVAADYVGYGVSKGQPHPYLRAAPTAAAVVDLLHAARDEALHAGLALNGQLFLVGYSEGGYATVAAHRALQAGGGALAEALVGSAPGGAPLDVGATLDELLRRVRRENTLLGLLVDPDLLQNLGETVRRQVRQELLKRLLPEDTDVVFDTRFIDNFLANDRAALNRDSDVHDWRPDKAMRVFHGRDDRTVPFVASENAVRAMLARGAPDLQWAECDAQPSDHLPCVGPYVAWLAAQLAPVIRDL